MKLTILLALFSFSVFASPLKPFAKTGGEIRGIAPLGSGNLLVLAEASTALIVDKSGKIIKSHSFPQGFNREPVAFPNGGAMGVTIAPITMADTYFVFFDKNGDLIKQMTYPGLSPAELKLEDNGLIQANPVGRALFFNSLGEIEKEVKYPPMVFYTPIFQISADTYFASTSEVQDRSVQFDSFFNLTNEVRSQSHRAYPSYAPAILNSGHVVVTRWDGEIVIYDGQGKLIDFDLADDLLVQPALTLDGEKFWVSTIMTTAVLEMQGNVMALVGAFPRGLYGLTRLDEHHLMGSDGNGIVILDQREVAQGKTTEKMRIDLDLQGRDYIYGNINKVGPSTYTATSRGGNIYKFKITL